MAGVLSRTDEALTPEEITTFLGKRVGEALLDTTVEYGLFTITLTNEGYAEAARLCRDERLLAFDMFDSSFGIDGREDGFWVVTILYSTTKGVRVALRTLAAGGREAPVCPSLVPIYPGADFMERETWDMFGIEFEGHPGLAPRILTVENFEGWPLRKDFYLTSRVAKPWPGVKEPAELDEDGNVVERVPAIGDAPGPMALDKVMADQAKLANPTAEPEQPTEPDAVETAADSGDVVESEKQEVEEDVAAAAGAAKAKAEERRKAQAEARARKAAERSGSGPVTTPADDVADVPEDAAAAPEAGAQGGPPAEGPAPGSGSHQADSDVEGGISETVERAREAGSVDPTDVPAPVEPEGREVDGGAGDDGEDEA